jgi:hypothetical protein
VNAGWVRSSCFGFAGSQGWVRSARLAMTSSPRLGSFARFATSGLGIWVRSVSFELAKPQAWVRFARFVFLVIGLASHQSPFLRSIAHPERRRFDPPSLTIETPEGSAALGSRKLCEIWYSPTEMGDRMREGAAGFLVLRTWSGNSLIRTRWQQCVGSPLPHSLDQGTSTQRWPGPTGTVL